MLESQPQKLLTLVWNHLRFFNVSEKCRSEYAEQIGNIAVVFLMFV